MYAIMIIEIKERATKSQKVKKMIIYNRCVKYCDCECVPYSTECDENSIEKIKEMPKNDGYDNIPTIGDIKGMNDFI